MKLPSIVRKLRKLSCYQISFTLFIIAMLTPASQAYMAGGSVNGLFTNHGSNNNENLVTTITITDSSIKTDVRPDELGSPYTPITQYDATSDQFTAKDSLAVHDSGAINLTNFSDTGTINNSFSISSLSDYTNESLNYGVTEIKSLLDYYTVEDEYDGVVTFDRDDYYTFAQEFKVEWDYALFYGSKLFLTYDLGAINELEDYELSLHLVSANSGDGNPNMTNIISNCTSNPYSQASPYGDNGLQFFDFTDVQITKGTYYIVGNLSKIDATDAPRHFQWAKNDHTSDGVDGGKTLYRVTGFPGLWSTAQAYDLGVVNYLHPVDSVNNSIIFTDPSEINLQDNELTINSNTASIVSIGSHELISNTSVQITYNNSYVFSKDYTANDIDVSIVALNSTFWTTDMVWDINWTTPEIDILTYTNLNRSQFIAAPADWETAHIFWYNDTNILLSNRLLYGYAFVIGANNSAGNWRLNVDSPNYINSLTLSESGVPTERFFLGSWTANDTHSFGFTGSDIDAFILVQGDGAGTPYNVTTGTLNYTIYDSNGNILPMKSSLPSNLVYTDTSSYTYAGLTNVSPGLFSSTISMDPSVSGSDLAGFWTVSVFWQNGTEAGYLTYRIVVQSQTMFEYEWETEPGSNVWTTSDISREGLDIFNVSTYYYNISETYLAGQRNVMPDAVVSYNFHNGTWSDSGFLTQTDEFFGIEYNISTGVDVGVYTFDLVATGAFVENLTASFDVTVFYKLALVPEYTNYQTNYTNNVLYYISLYDVTHSSNLSLPPDDMTVTVTNGTDFPLSSPIDYTFLNITTELWVLNISTSTNNLYTGLYSVEIAISLNDYQANYTDVYVSDVYTFEITAPKTLVEEVVYPSDIYLYHNAEFSFSFKDANHSTALLGANLVASASVINISFSYNTIGDVYYVTVTNNNYLASSFDIYVDITLANYEPVTSFLLGQLSVLTIQTSLTEDTTPTEVYVGNSYRTY